MDSVYALSKSRKGFYHVTFTAGYCRQCHWAEWYRIHELYRQGSAGTQHYILEPRHFFRCFLVTGKYRWDDCHPGFPFIFSVRKKSSMHSYWEKRKQLIWVYAERLKSRIMILNTAMVAVATAFVMISFMGLCCPISFAC